MTAPLAPLTLEGWYVLHQFFRVERPDTGGEDGARARLAELFEEWEDLGEEGWSGFYRIVGGGDDVLVIHFRPTLEALGEVERVTKEHADPAGLVFADDYLSVVELGLYATTAALVEKARMEGVELHSEAWGEMVAETLEVEREKKYTQMRLYPRQPEEMPYVCGYPMDKRRNPGQNWYVLDVEERARLMLEHGMTGRRYAGRISQIISGSIGLDDWEWFVTLFSGDPLEFKNLVTEMRYDEVSALYAEFGTFWVGRRVPAEAIGGEG